MSLQATSIKNSVVVLIQITHVCSGNIVFQIETFLNILYALQICRLRFQLGMFFLQLRQPLIQFVNFEGF